MVRKQNQTETAQNSDTNDLLCVTPNTVVNRISTSNKQTRDTIKQGEAQMAEVDTNMLSEQHSDIRREAAVYAGDTRFNIADKTSDVRREVAASTDTLNDAIRVEGGTTRTASALQTSDVIKEGLKGDFHTSDAIKDSRFDIASRIADSTANLSQQIDRIDDTTMDKFFTVARDTADLRAQVIQAIDTTKMATELAALKSIIEGQKNTIYLSDKIGDDGEKTRGLINDLKYHDLSRGLIERNNELVEERNWGRHWYAGANQAQFGQQFAQLQSQMQNFNSQLSETRQGMVNFGTMAGVGQTSSANNVR